MGMYGSFHFMSEISKTERKRRAQKLHKLSETLSELSPSQLNKIPLPESLSDAFQSLRKTHSNGARKRQLQYIGKLMRMVETENIERALADITQATLLDTRRFHQLEDWRKRLLCADEAFSEFLNQYPSTNRNELRKLIDAARTHDDKAHLRLLFRFIAETTGKQPRN